MENLYLISFLLRKSLWWWENFSSVQLLSCVRLFAIPWTAACQASLSIPELAQTHVPWVSDTIQPSHPLLPPFPSALDLPQHQGLFQWVISLHQGVYVLDLQLQHQPFQWIFRVDFLQGWLVLPPCSPRDSQEPSLAPQFEIINSLALSRLYGSTLTSIHDDWKNHSFDVGKSDVSAC